MRHYEKKTEWTIDFKYSSPLKTPRGQKELPLVHFTSHPQPKPQPHEQEASPFFQFAQLVTLEVLSQIHTLFENFSQKAPKTEELEEKVKEMNAKFTFLREWIDKLKSDLKNTLPED